MLVELAVVVASIFPVMIVGKVTAIKLSDWRWTVPIVQTVVSAAVALAAFVLLSGFTIYFVTAMLAYPFAINFGAIVSFSLQKKRALDGSYGEETQWAAELVEEGDQEFAMAVNALPKVELKELGIIADSKEELRDLTIDRLDELTEDPLPEDFAQ